MIVDDDEGSCRALRVIFKDDYDILVPNGSAGAIELARRRKIHVVLIEGRLAGMAGNKVVEQLKSLDASIQAVMMTAFSMGEPSEVSVDHYITKPFDVVAIRAAVAAAVQRGHGGSRPLNEAKLTLVGRGGVGKTCLIKRLLSGTFDMHEKETPGIEIQQWGVEVPSGDLVRLHVWDFGGQEILHATHQFFLTERTLYLLVLSGREGKPGDDAEYWLQLIRSFGGDSKVIVVLNKSIEHPFDVNRGFLKEKYPFIVDFIATDCRAGTGLAALKNLILQQTDALEHRRVAFPSDWFDIKERLAGMKEDFLTWEQYQEICSELGEPNPQAQRDLARYLHILGVALNYMDDPRLRDTHVLNPRWVTEGIYSLLRYNSKKLTRLDSMDNHEKVRDATDEAGEFDYLKSRKPPPPNPVCIFEACDLRYILDKNRYPESKYEFLLQLMERFQLCFKLPDAPVRFLVPELLYEDQPDIRDQLARPGLRFRYQYEVLPEGLLPRFIVQTHTYSENQQRWRTGVVLKWNDCHAVVRADYRERRVDIHITGEVHARRRELLAVIREKLGEQHRDLKGLTIEERVPVPEEKEATVSYRKLLTLEERGVSLYEPEDLDRSISVQELLNGLESSESRAKRREGSLGMVVPKEFHFYAGAHAHFEGDDMKRAGRDIHEQNISGSTFTNSPVAIRQLLQNSYNTIQQASDEGLKMKLEELHGQVAQLMGGLEPKKGEEVKENFEALVKEVTRPEPRKKWYALSSEGLIEAAKAAKDLAAPIANAVKEIGRLLFPSGG
jgi:GTPase SAR1 family protein/CheY-like chemotaxis protein